MDNLTVTLQVWRLSESTQGQTFSGELVGMSNTTFEVSHTSASFECMDIKVDPGTNSISVMEGDFLGLEVLEEGANITLLAGTEEPSRLLFVPTARTIESLSVDGDMIVLPNSTIQVTANIITGKNGVCVGMGLGGRGGGKRAQLVHNIAAT